MTLPLAIKRFEARFESVSDALRADGDPELMTVCSGGTITSKEITPALYASEELAINAWVEEAMFQTGGIRNKLEWVVKPELSKFQITMADRRGMHRMVSPRYSVKSQFRTS